jgi:hypothetical protein
LKNLIPKTKTLLILAASEVPNTDGLFPENAPQARILKMASSASVTIGNDDKLTTACIQLVATDEEMSDKLLKIVQGLTAMLSLAQSDDKQISDFLRSVKAERVGKNIVLNLSIPSDTLVNVIHGIAQNEPANKTTNENSTPDKPAIQDAAADKVIRTWLMSKDSSENAKATESFRYQTLNNVVLKNSSTIILTGAGENARFDYIEVTPSAGGQPLRFEAENMKLSHYRVEKHLHASGGKLIVHQGHSIGTARLEFPGVDGSYTLKIRYLDENNGKAVFTVSTRDHEPSTTDEGDTPEAPEAPVAPEAPAAPQAK